MTVASQLATILPARWPERDRGSSRIGQENGGHMLIADVLAGRDPKKTGSRWWVEDAIDVVMCGSPTKAKSLNHDTVRRLMVWWAGHDEGRKAFLDILNRQIEHGEFSVKKFTISESGKSSGGGEQGSAGYGRLHDCYHAAALWLALKRGDDEVAKVCRTLLARRLGHLNKCEWGGSVYMPGVRSNGPWGTSFAIDEFRRALKGEEIDLSPGNRCLGYSQGSKGQGGEPYALSVWAAMALQEIGVLIAPEPPVLQWPEVVIKNEHGILSYLSKLEGKPGDGGILVAIEMLSGLTEPHCWVAGAPKKSQKQPGVEFADIPGQQWGFDPKKGVVAL